MPNGRKRLLEQYDLDNDARPEAKKTANEVKESVEISGRVSKPWEDETITEDMKRSPEKYDLHWCKFGSLKQHHWSRRPNHYFKKNGDCSSTCLYHKRIAHSPKNVKAQSAKASEEHKRILAEVESIENVEEREELLLTSNIYRQNKKGNAKDKKRADDLKLLGKCPGALRKACTEGNDAAPGRVCCSSCQAIVDTHNAKHNGTNASLKSLRRHRARVKGRVMPSTPVYDVLASRPAHFAALLSSVENVVTSEKVIVWDTESDGRGAKNVLEKTREYYFHKVWTKEFLHIRRDEEDYSHQAASQNILEFIADADYLVAYEPNHCDRLRLHNLLLECGQDFDSIGDKFVDFKYRIVDAIIGTSEQSSTKAYLPDLTLNTVSTFLFSVDGKQDEVPTGLHLVDAPSDWSRIGDKCKLDVHRLCNLLLVVRSLFVAGE